MTTTTRRYAAAAAALAVAAFAGAVALGASPDVRATCTKDPKVTQGATVVSFDVHCSVPLAAAATVTVTATPTDTPAEPSPSGSTSPSSTPSSSSTSTPSPSATGALPTEASVGTTGSLTKRAGGTLPAGTYTNVEFTSAVRLDAAGVTLRNVKAPAVTMYGTGRYVLDRVDTGGVFVDSYYNAIDGVTMTGVRVRGSDGDGVDIFSNTRFQISNVVIDGLIADGFTFPSGSDAHGDGIQVRGVTNLALRNAIVDMGPWQPQKNAALYLEDVGQGIRSVTVDNVRLAGGGYTFYTAPARAASTLRNVSIFRSGNWGPVLVEGNKADWTFTNVTGPAGQQLTP
ncbi:hypothetical protein G7075_04220 [Phycicoccus sp. HDW14]|uniref:hypothetical protein n=1 Tax=Phycicoccus sp. HDW14 TaxID=2714941 RepID=UPI00140C5440|nr:hypothetical protein [Phycicoccus sp. HDW14]QIM20525.1 hypothetical protein G7075_04220 [Phycicoccus sp. HDW14]